MTVVDFRSGGYDDTRGSYGHGDTDIPYRAHDWNAEDWDDLALEGQQDGARLSDRSGVLGRVARLTHYLGALVSVVLMLALLVWGYQLVVRDVSGVPVIRAVEGEARIAPEEPGGMLSDREGLAVNNVAAGAESAPVERVAIAPAPTALDGQDVAMGELGATAREPAAIDEIIEPAGTPAIAMSDAESARQAVLEAEAEAAAMATGVPAVAPAEADSVSVAAAVTDTNGQPALDTAITAALAEAGAAPSVGTPTRPMPRPRRIAAVAPAASAPAAVAETVTDAAPVAEAPVETPPVQLASGAPLVQIGAFDSGAIAESEWSRISGRYGDLFAGKAPVVQQHKAGGRTFYRLRIAGFESRDEARKFCAALIAAGNDCIPAAAQ